MDPRRSGQPADPPLADLHRPPPVQARWVRSRSRSARGAVRILSRPEPRDLAPCGDIRHERGGTRRVPRACGLCGRRGRGHDRSSRVVRSEGGVVDLCAATTPCGPPRRGGGGLDVVGLAALSFLAALPAAGSTCSSATTPLSDASASGSSGSKRLTWAGF